MAEIHNIEQKNEADRRAALLALAAGRKNDEQTICLDADEMASLVDHQCSADDQERYFAHLADCDICYRQWLELSELTQTGTTGKDKAKVQKLFRPRYLAWAGSALAAAASIALFLNITREAQLPVMQQSRPPKAERSLTPSSTIGQSEKKFDFKGVPAGHNIEELKDTVPLEMEIPAPVSSPSRKAISNASESVLPKKQKAHPAALKEEVQVQGISEDMAADGFTRESVDSGRVEVDGWIERIQQGCLNGEEKTKFWQQQSLEGKKLIQLEVFNTPEEEKLVNDILSLVVQLRAAPETRQAVCNRIQDRIARNRAR